MLLPLSLLHKTEPRARPEAPLLPINHGVLLPPAPDPHHALIKTSFYAPLFLLARAHQEATG
jgi:hypothetical protein